MKKIQPPKNQFKEVSVGEDGVMSMLDEPQPDDSGCFQDSEALADFFECQVNPEARENQSPTGKEIAGANWSVTLS